jgi:hypothetical protein
MLNDNPTADVDISVTDELDAADAAVISDGLRAHYVSQAGYYDFCPLAVLVRDPKTGRVIGGLHGRSEFGLVYVAWFFLPEGPDGKPAAGGSLLTRRCDGARLIHHVPKESAPSLKGLSGNADFSELGNPLEPRFRDNAPADCVGWCFARCPTSNALRARPERQARGSTPQLVDHATTRSGTSPCPWSREPAAGRQ